MANRLRGEVEVVIRGKPHILRLSNEGIANAEDKADYGCMELSRRVLAGKCGQREIAAIIFGGLIGGGYASEFTFEEVKALLLEEGQIKYFKPASSLLAFALKGAAGLAPDEEPKPSPEKKTENRAKPKRPATTPSPGAHG